MSIRLFVVAVALTALVLSGCISNPLESGSKTTASAEPAQDAVKLTPARATTTQRAGKAALDALGAEVVKTKGDYRLCSMVDEYRMCGGSPCHKGGLKATTYFVCRQVNCAGQEVPTPESPSFASYSSCVSGCRKAEQQWRSKGVPLETFYCTH